MPCTTLLQHMKSEFADFMSIISKPAVATQFLRKRVPTALLISYKADVVMLRARNILMNVFDRKIITISAD